MVIVRCCRGANEQVWYAEPVFACRSPLLNNSALRTVRRQWHFRPGPVRIYEVEIRFERTRPKRSQRA